MKRIKSLIQQLGYSSTASYLTSRALVKFFGIYMQHYKFYSQPVHSKPRVARSKLDRYEFTWIDKPEKILDQLDRPKNIIEDRFNQGSICLIAKQQDSLQGCLWFVRSKYIEDDVRATYYFSENRVWDYDVYVTPKKRFTILFAALWDTADAWMKEHNIASTLSRISVYNPQSIRSHEAAGAKQIGWMIAIVIKNWQLTISDRSPKLHFSSKNNKTGPSLYFTKI
jgi:hypothetical protein